MPAPRCVRCDRPFPANHTLSTLPEGRRIALDPDRGRLWRICTACGEWNLLSRFDASLSLPEIERLAAGLPTEAIDEGLARSGNGALELLRVELSPGILRDPAVAERHSPVTRRQNRMAIVGVVAIAALSTMPWWGGGIRYVAGLAGALWSAQLVARVVRTRRLGLGRGTLEFVLAALLLLLAILAAVDSQQLGFFLTMWAWMTPLQIFLNRGMPFGWTRLPSGGKVWVRRRELDQTRIRVDESGSLRLTLPNGRALDVEDSAAVLRDLLDGYSWETTSEAQQIGSTLVQDVEPLEGIIAILRPALEVDPDGLPLVQLPPPWRAALDLAFAAKRGTPGRLSALAAKAREAQQVAEIAESLDRNR